MRKRMLWMLVVAWMTLPALAQTDAGALPAFEVATVKRSDPDSSGRYNRMENDHRFVAKNYPLRLLLAVAFDLTPKAVTGGPEWIDSELFDVEAVTPGPKRPTPDAYRAMLRQLLTERFQLQFHRQDKEFAIYALSVAKGGPKLQPAADPDAITNVVCTVEPGQVVLPARNATMRDLTLMMQRAVFNRPVVDRTGLTARYDFTLEWRPDETQFGGGLPAGPDDAAAKPPLLEAMRDQLGLKFESTRGTISTMVIDGVKKPLAN